MNLNVANGTEIQLADESFAVDYNQDLVHQVVIAYMANGRKGSKALKSRSEVRGGGRKPWRQKGSGRARVGSIRSPLWRGGGVTFGSSRPNFQQKINKKMYRAAVRSIVSELIRQDRLIVVEDFVVDVPKTKELVARLAKYDLSKRLLIVTEDLQENLFLASRNIPNVDVIESSYVNPVSLVASEKVIITVVALKQLEEKLA